jgi:hypothetical protein
MSVKTLVIGIDGLDDKLLPLLPFLKSIVSTSTQYNVDEDLWVRGWSKVIVGSNAQKCNSYYNRPLCNKSLKTTSSVGTKNYDHSDPIWKILNDKGIKCGYINLPTTMPAPKINGFFVSGPGAGYDPSSNIPKEACHPEDIYNSLSENAYVWEERWSCSKARDLPDFINRLKEEVSQKTDLMVKLSFEYETDFNFLMLRTIDALCSLIYPFVLEVAEGRDNKYKKDIKSLFQHLDDKLKLLVGQISPSNIMIVSDHGYNQLDYNINLNQLLQSNSFQIKSDKNSVGLISMLKNMYSRLPLSIRVRIRRYKGDNSTMSRMSTYCVFDPEKSIAFSLRYIPGIYLNDERFYSVTPSDKRGLVESIVDVVNSSSECNSINIRASAWSGEDKLPISPDIYIESNMSIFFSNSGPLLLNVKTDSNYLERLLRTRIHDQILGNKSSKALLSYSGEFKNNTSCNDLSLSYKIIKNIY